MWSNNPKLQNLKILNYKGILQNVRDISQNVKDKQKNLRPNQDKYPKRKHKSDHTWVKKSR